jgi:hypothetical protein
MKAFAKGEWKRAKTVRYKGNDEVGETDAEVEETRRSRRKTLSRLHALKAVPWRSNALK